jgi:type I restriction enzyme S subunit
LEQFRLQKDDVPMTEGGDFDKLGRGAIRGGQTDPCIHQNPIFRVRTDRDQVLPEYFSALLLNPCAKTDFLTASKQTTNLATVNMTQLNAFPVSVPPVVLPRRFVLVERQYNRLPAQQREALRQAELWFGVLLDRAFRGAS